jgi:hypothetical protein
VTSVDHSSARCRGPSPLFTVDESFMCRRTVLGGQISHPSRLPAQSEQPTYSFLIVAHAMLTLECPADLLFSRTCKAVSATSLNATLGMSFQPPLASVQSRSVHGPDSPHQCTCALKKEGSIRMHATIASRSLPAQPHSMANADRDSARFKKALSHLCCYGLFR